MHPDVLSGDRPGFGQQGKLFWSSLDGSRLDAPGTIANALLRDQDVKKRYLVPFLVPFFFLHQAHPHFEVD